MAKVGLYPRGMKILHIISNLAICRANGEITGFWVLLRAIIGGMEWWQQSLMWGGILIIPMGGLTAYTIMSTPMVYEKPLAATSLPATSTLAAASDVPAPPPTWPLPLDTEEYDERLLKMVNYMPRTEVVTIGTSSATTTRVVNPLQYSSSTNVTVAGERWPAAAAYPHGGVILPFERIVAYYGNFYSRNMGILGEYEPNEVLARLASTSAAWEAADPDTPVRPAMHYIAMVGQGDAGVDGMWRNVMPDEHLEKAYNMAKEIDGIMFIDLQVGLSTLERELPKFRSFLERPEVHVGIDPEFSMKSGNAPGTVIGTFDAKDVNYVIEYLSEIVREQELPPKVLVVHRFTQKMVTNYQNIKPTPEVQVVMHMDGWGPVELKKGTYRHYIEPEPVQFTGLKIFYKNDLKSPSTGLFTPAEALRLQPAPLYIQYQ